MVEGLDTAEERVDLLDVAGLEAVTLVEVVAVAKETFETGQVSLTTLGPLREQELDLSCLDFSVE